MSSDPLTIISSLVPSVPNRELNSFLFARTCPTAEAFRSLVLQCCCCCCYCELLVRAFASPSPLFSPFRFNSQSSSRRGAIFTTEHVGLLSDLLAFNFRHGDRYAQVLRWSLGASLRFSYRRIYLVLFPLHHYPRPCGHLDGMFLMSIVSC